MESGLQSSPASLRRDQNAGGPDERVDDIADPQNELLHPAVEAGIHGRLVQIDLRLLKLCLRAGLLGGQQRGQLNLGGLSCGVGRRRRPFAAVESDFELFNVAGGHVAGIAPRQFLLGAKLVESLGFRALGLLDLALRRENVGFCRDHPRIDFVQPPLRNVERRHLFCAVQFEDRLSLFNFVTELHKNLAHAAVYFRQNRH